jgi:hypothetical protein
VTGRSWRATREEALAVRGQRAGEEEALRDQEPLFGPGDNVVLDAFSATTVTSATVEGNDWLTDHASTIDGNTVLDVGGKERTLPRANLDQLARGVTAS